MSLKNGMLIAAFIIASFTAIVSAEEKKDRLYPRGPEIQKLKSEGGLTDADIAKIKAALEGVEKKSLENSAKAEVKAAEESLKIAKEALKAAEEKLKGASDNFDLLDERKKAVFANAPDDKKLKVAELINYKIKVEKAEKKEKKD